MDRYGGDKNIYGKMEWGDLVDLGEGMEEDRRIMEELKKGMKKVMAG